MKRKTIIITGLMCMVAGLSQAQIRVFNMADNVAVTNSPAFVDASSNLLANNNQSWGKGLVFPRVDLSVFTLPSITGGYGKATNFPTYLDGMIVYNTKTGGVAGVGSTEGTLTPGFWYYDNKSSSETGGTWKQLGSSAAAALEGSASIVLNGDSLVRAALTGDVTANANSNVTTIANNAVTSAKIADGTIATADLANNTVTTEKINAGAVTAVKLNQMGASSGQVLKWNGSAWAPAADNNDNTNTTYSGSASVILSSSSFQRAALSGDVTANANSNTVTINNSAITAAKLADNSVTSAKIAANTIIAADLNAMGASSGQVLTYSGGSWGPATPKRLYHIRYTCSSCTGKLSGTRTVLSSSVFSLPSGCSDSWAIMESVSPAFVYVESANYNIWHVTDQIGTSYVHVYCLY